MIHDHAYSNLNDTQPILSHTKQLKFKVNIKYFMSIINIQEILSSNTVNMRNDDQAFIDLPIGITKEFFRTFLEFTLNY